MSTNPKDAIGLTKPALRLVPPALALHVATAMADGAKKYGAYNWRQNAVRNTVYVEAALRHLYAYLDGEDRARDSQRLHLAHVGACIAILLDALEYGNLIDDRATAGPAADIIDRLTPAGPPGGYPPVVSNVEWTDISVTLNGKPFEGISELVYDDPKARAERPKFELDAEDEPDEPIPYKLAEPQPLIVPGTSGMFPVQRAPDFCFVCEHDFCTCPQSSVEKIPAERKSRPTAPYFLFENEINETTIEGEKVCITLDLEELGK